MTKSTDDFLDIPAQQAQFRDLISDALQCARQVGASDAAAEISESRGLSVAVRHCKLETIEQTRDRGLAITVFAGQRRGSASTSDFSADAIRRTVEAAWHIARHTAEDPAAGLPDPDQLALHYPDLDLHHPWAIDVPEAARLAIRAERAALATSDLITNTEGASLDTSEGHFVLGNTQGFLGGYPYSRHSLSVAPIAGHGDGMQRDYWYTAARDAQTLAAPLQVGRYAAQRALSRLNARSIKTGHYPVLFEAPLAVGLLGALVQATSGGALYRKASFMLDSLGKTVLADHLDVVENPYIPGAQGSSPFDGEGVRPQARRVVDCGLLTGYFLSTYTARKLGMSTTGNAGGSHNLSLRSRLTQPDDTLAAMLQKMGTGLLVTELIGQGVNYVTGDYSRGAFGYWVQDGQISHPVHEVTIAGNLSDMFRQIIAIGADVHHRGAKSTGSILIEKMAVAGL
ncbi:metalloprotease PmbA [Castellaniella sp.]|uniref:metalloprotease PmbA n=1 Tax=Castellaniella sp. TaxID=1955812 RepID=UPI002AFF1CFF|nr:metalloprotease PmbA [Castellaniella sp.]